MNDTALETTRALGRQLIDEFGKGWSRAKIDQMMAVFAPDAVFVETPFSEPIRGDAVRAYWADVPAHQSEISFTSGEIFAAGPDGIRHHGSRPGAHMPGRHWSTASNGRTIQSAI